MFWKQLATPLFYTLGLVQGRNNIAGADRNAHPVASHTTLPSRSIPAHYLEQRDTATDCWDGGFSCGDTNPVCLAVGTPCTDSTVRTGPTLCTNTPVFSLERDDQGNPGNTYIGLDNTCACVQDGQFTPASYANISQLLRTDPKALNVEHNLCNVYGISQDSCLETIIPSFIESTYVKLSTMSTTCEYPSSNFSPVCGDACAFEQRDTATDCWDGGFSCGDTNPVCLAVGTPCTDSTVRTGPTLCTNTPVFSLERDDQGNPGNTYIGLDNTCACVQDGQFTPASYANISQLLRTDPKALNVEHNLCNVYGISQDSCLETIIPSFIESTYVKVVAAYSLLQDVISGETAPVSRALRTLSVLKAFASLSPA
ncbi:hypothetical protein QFC21_002107 [Naganishia friedmannii]|uniref:Uncharacterized protein n=1 Tax=Naganishia friedmannii TaxID=89922 RepID=A0ACC2W039_9TREE|nr:hypothetical protein QFC21_002107 [Naganishia friedmannii]